MEIKLAEIIRSFRKERKLTQEQLAEVLCVTPGAVYKWEAGLSIPDLTLIMEMADFLNRRSYEEDLNDYLTAPVPNDLTYITIDINGLKGINDQYGHDAGDKLIVGIARCIEGCFGNSGKTYRIGGDEYVVILPSAPENMDAVLNAFEESMRTWSESNGLRLTASFGCVFASELPGEGITAIAKAADAKMYENKNLYYQMSKNDKSAQAAE